MCGFAGLLTGSQAPAGMLEDTAKRMAARLVHRGPDDEGAWSDPAVGLAFGFRRLAILDLTPAGHQPMLSRAGRYAVVFNGEIYNWRSLRAELDRATGGLPWRGHSDTEVLLEAVEYWGIERTLNALNGMFAIALWDREDRVLHLARDRLGEKPLYYGWTRDGFLFGSELKALASHPGAGLEIDRDALALYLHHAYVPGPLSIYREFHKLSPGCWLTLPASAAANDVGAEIRPYWSVKDKAEEMAAQPFRGDERAAEDRLDELLHDSVRLRLEADVPVGAFLSGGIDSSTVVAIMQRELGRPARSFSIGFDDPRFDEAPFARRIARHLGTDHTELYVRDDDALSLLPRLPEIYDEPFADVSAIPTVLLAQLTRRHVTVGLSGDGGDELFGGYPRYPDAARRWLRIARLPSALRRAARVMSGCLPAAQSGALFRVSRRLEEMASADAVEFYRRYVSRWRVTRNLARGANPRVSLFDGSRVPALESPQALFMALDAAGYLPDDLLVKIDRATMAYGLEARAPLLDHRIAEFAWSLPESLKIRPGGAKWLLRQVLARYVPREMWERPKQGFEPPVGAWLRGPLRDWAEDLLSEKRLREDGFIDPVPVRRRWAEHLSGRRDWRFELWTVLMFQAWRERWRRRR